MPALPPVPGVLKVEHDFGIGEDINAKVRQFWKYASSPPSVAEVTAVATAIAAAASGDIAGLFDSTRKYIQTVITDLSSSTGAQGHSGIVNTPGTRSGAALPGDTCALQSQPIARRFRGGHSRLYWPFGTGTDMTDDQTWNNTFITAVITGLEAFEGHASSSMIANGITAPAVVAVSFYEGFTVHTGVTGRARNVSTPRAAPVVDVRSTFLIHAGIATQRRRMLRLA